MGLAWQQGPLASGAIGRFLVPDPLPGRLLYAEPLSRRMRVRFAGAWIADSEDVMLLHEPGRCPVAYFPLGAITDSVLEPSEHATRHQEASGARPEGAEAWPDAFAVSPAIGPLPAIYVPPSPSQATAPGLLGHATVRAGGWAECCRGGS